RIETAVFFKCHQLKKIIIPENVEFISPDAFSYCSSLQEISVDPKNKFYASKDGALYDKSFKTLLKVPDTKTEINIADTVEKFFHSTFENCRFLSKIELPLSVTDIPIFSFDNCKALKEFNIHQNIKTIGWDIFRHAENLEKFTVHPLNPNFSTEDDVLYDHEKINLLKFPPAKEKITIPSTVKNIATSAFSTSKNLKEVTIPETVEKIKTWAFANCPLLTKITLLVKKPVYMSEAFQIGRKKTFYVPKEAIEEYKKSNDMSWKNANYIGIKKK
ncbi:MAG TPA: leucine-rich repeat protein, partial [Chryseobacterium sp.]